MELINKMNIARAVMIAIIVSKFSYSPLAQCACLFLFMIMYAVIFSLD